MTEIRFHMPYRLPGKVTRHAIARVVLDIPELECAVRAVTQQMYTGQDIHYLSEAGRIWVPSKAGDRPFSGIRVSDFINENDESRTFGMIQRLWSSEDHPFLLSMIHFRDLLDGKMSRLTMRPATGPVLVDTEEMSEEFLASTMWHHVRTLADTIRIADGVFHARSIGPTVGYYTGYQPDYEDQRLHWEVENGDIRFRGHPLTFCMDELPLAIEYARSIGGDTAVEPRKTPRLHGVAVPATDTLDHATENLAFSEANARNYMRVENMSRSTMAAMVELRRLLQERHPGHELDFTGQHHVAVPGGRFDPVAGTEELMEPLRVLARSHAGSDISRTKAGALDFRRAARVHALSPQADDDAAIGASFG